MAKATIVHLYADGDAVTFSMRADLEHPDALDQIATRVLRMYREAVLEADEADDV